MSSPPRSCRGRSCHPHRRPSRFRRDRAVRVRPAGRRTPPTRHPLQTPRAGLLPAGGADPALVCRRHPAGQLAADNAISASTVYRYLHEGIDVLAAQAPGLRGALLAARAAGHSHVTVDGTLIRTDRCSAPGPTGRRGRPEMRVDLWWSGKHAAHGGNIQVLTVPDGWPIWTSGVRPGREHDTTALRADPEALPLLAEWTDADHAALG